MNCSKCGSPLMPGAISCANCGLQFSQPVPGAYPPPPIAAPPPKSKVPVWVWIGGCGAAGCLPVVIFAAILFPVFAHARERARDVSCQSNEKQMGLALVQYEQDYDNTLPPAATWMEATYPYIKYSIRCPDVSTADTTSYGYAFNSKLNRAKVADISNPAEAPTVYDSTNLGRNANDALTSIPSPPRHDSHNNYAFVDGHVESLGSPPGM